MALAAQCELRGRLIPTAAKSLEVPATGIPGEAAYGNAAIQSGLPPKTIPPAGSSWRFGILASDMAFMKIDGGHGIRRRGQRRMKTDL